MKWDIKGKVFKPWTSEGLWYQTSVLLYAVITVHVGLWLLGKI